MWASLTPRTFVGQNASVFPCWWSVCVFVSDYYVSFSLAPWSSKYGVLHKRRVAQGNVSITVGDIITFSLKSVFYLQIRLTCVFFFSGVTAQRGYRVNWIIYTLSSTTLWSSKISTDMPSTLPEWVCCVFYAWKTGLRSLEGNSVVWLGSKVQVNSRIKGLIAEKTSGNWTISR